MFLFFFVKFKFFFRLENHQNSLQDVLAIRSNLCSKITNIDENTQLKYKKDSYSDASRLINVSKNSFNNSKFS